MLDDNIFVAIELQEYEEFYGDIVKKLPMKMSESHDSTSDITWFINAKWAGIVVMQRLHMGLIIFVQIAPII